MKPKTIDTLHQKQLTNLGNLIREFRFSFGLTQKELGTRTNIHTRTIQRLESGKNITLLSIFKIADALEIGVNEIFEL
nr:helix-turn-helix transcriptional regulator [uncultured Draconibacterium sp.]